MGPPRYERAAVAEMAVGGGYRVDCLHCRRVAVRPVGRVVVGFSGTRAGVSPEQAETLLSLLLDFAVGEFHHGDCRGADAEAHALAGSIDGIYLVSHPPTNDRLRAFCPADEVLPCRPYRERNADIVRAVTVLIAAPRADDEERFGGTWGTIRIARAHRKPVIRLLRKGGLVPERTHGNFFGV